MMRKKKALDCWDWCWALGHLFQQRPTLSAFCGVHPSLPPVFIRYTIRVTSVGLGSCSHIILCSFFLFQVQIRAIIKVVSRHFVRFSFYIAGLAAKGLSHVAALIPRGVKAIRRNQPSARAASYYKRGAFDANRNESEWNTISGDGVMWNRAWPLLRSWFDKEEKTIPTTSYTWEIKIRQRINK